MTQFILFVVYVTIVFVTGLLLALDYSSDFLEAFYLVLDIIKDVNNGWSIKLLHTSAASTLVTIVYLYLIKLTIASQSLIVFKSKILASPLFLLPYIYPNEITNFIPLTIWPFNILSNLDMQSLFYHYLDQESLYIGGQLEDLYTKGLLYMEGNPQSTPEPLPTIHDYWQKIKAKHGPIWNTQLDKNIEIAEKIKSIIQNNPDGQPNSGANWSSNRTPYTVDTLVSQFNSLKDRMDRDHVAHTQIAIDIQTSDKQQEEYMSHHNSISTGLRNLERRGLMTDDLSTLKKSRDSLAVESKKARGHFRALLVKMDNDYQWQETTTSDILKCKAAIKYAKTL